MKRLTALILALLMTAGCVTCAYAYDYQDEIRELLTPVFRLLKNDRSLAFAHSVNQNGFEFVSGHNPSYVFFIDDANVKSCEKISDQQFDITATYQGRTYITGKFSLYRAFDEQAGRYKLVGIQSEVKGMNREACAMMTGMFGSLPQSAPGPASVPTTGDAADLALYAALMLGAAAVIAVSRKKRNCR